MRLKSWILCAILLVWPLNGRADFAGYWQDLQKDVAKVWDSEEYDMYIPLYAWHNRLAYDQKHIDKYNENPWGFGLGKSYYDDKGNWHSLYVMAFKDSNDYAETFFGYAWMKYWYVNCNRDLRVGVGYTLGLTQRHEWNYIPVPAPLPLAGIEYKRVALQAAYVPGVKNDGNVLFIWSRIAIN